MGFTSNNHLQTDASIKLKDWQHAARMFADQQFRLAPKFDFQFHVAFNINKAACKNANIVTRYGNEINMLVKTVALPRFELEADQVNQYNRTKQIQYHHKLGDIIIKFHDDNMGLINQVWQNYYSYYYADSTSSQTPGAYARTATKNSNYITTPYGLDNASTTPFFNYITIYQMARHEYVAVKLINPIIKMWDGLGLDYSSTKVHDFSMTVAYEAVNYSVGQVVPGDPEGFGLEHYDNSLSPLQGVNPDRTVISPSFVQALDIQGNAASFVNNAVNTVNGYQNSTESVNGGGFGSKLGSVLGLATLGIGLGGQAISALGGLSGISFPSLGGLFGGDKTSASPSTLGDGGAANGATDATDTQDSGSSSEGDSPESAAGGGDGTNMGDGSEASAGGWP